MFRDIEEILADQPATDFRPALTEAVAEGFRMPGGGPNIAMLKC
jgi:hypothetical protein